LIGERADTAYGYYEWMGDSAKALSDFVASKGGFADKFKEQ
jgi:NADH dehydrogenase (ubiquinone) Fe-S protein 1